MKLSNIQKTCGAVGASMAHTLDMLNKDKAKAKLRHSDPYMRSLTDTAAMLGHINIDLYLVRRQFMRPTRNAECRNFYHPVT